MGVGLLTSLSEGMISLIRYAMCNQQEHSFEIDLLALTN